VQPGRGPRVLAAAVGRVVSEPALVVLYFGLVFPGGVLLRLLERDPLALRFDRRARTCWKPKEQPRGAASYSRQS
jgi:hypothetical protein